MKLTTYWCRWVIASALACGAQPLRAAEDVGHTILGGDRLRISVEEEPEMNRVYPVAGDGTIDFGYIGRVRIAGMTVAEAADHLEALLEEKYFRSATVTAEVAEFVEGDVLMLGELSSPGPISLSGDRILTLVEAISLSGGFTKQAAGHAVRILRWKTSGTMERDSIVVDVQSMMDSLDFTKDEYLRPRDMVVVPRLGEGEGGAEFLALGEVGAAGFHPHTEGLDMLRAISRIGVGKDAQMEAASILRPDGRGGYTKLNVDISRLLGAADMSQNLSIYPGDILFVPSSSHAFRGRIYLLGEVSHPGAVALPNDRDATLAKTILRSGGFTKFANDGKVRILRTGPDGEEREVVVNVARILKTGAFQEDVPLLDGDVVIVPEKILNL